MVKPRSFKPKSKKKLNKKEQQHLLNIYEDDFESNKGKHLRQHNLDQMSGGVDQYHKDHIASDDDEEIDSDDAFGENEMDDQYDAMVLGLKDRKREAKLKSKINKNQDDSDDSDDDRFDKEIILEEGETFVDLSTLLDDQTLVATEEDYLDSKPKRVKYQDLIGDADIQDDENDFNLMDFEHEDDEEEDDDEDYDQSPSDYDDNDEPSNLTKFITSLDSEQNKKKFFLNDPTSNRKESEFNFGASAYDDVNNGKLDLKSLLKPLENESGFDHLQNKVQDLIHTSKSQIATLKAPKVKRMQDKIIRTAAYEESKEQISQWESIIKENREKEHLSFTQTESAAVQPKSTNVLTNHTKVENDMEKEIFEALQSHNIQDKNLKNFEDLQTQQLTAQELKDRQKKMMQLRNLMFKEELKAKRVAKIKSKAYRKILRKEKAKLTKLQEEMDGDQDLEDSDEEATKDEIARARERMSLKHQNTTKWAKNLMKHGGREAESHQAITEQLQEHERLKQKIVGKSNEDEESDDDYDELDNGTIDTSDKKQVINFAFNELNKIVDDDEEEKPNKGIMSMKFMQKALEKQKKETEELAQQAQEDLRLLNRDSDDDYTHDQNASEDEDEDEDDTKHRKVVQGNEGRLQFTGIGTNAEEQDELLVPSKKHNKKDKSAKTPKPQLSKSGVYAKATDERNEFGEKAQTKETSVDGEVSNPWLSHQDDLPLAGIKSKKNQGSQLSQTEKATLKISKAKSSANDKEQANLSKVKINAEQTLSNIIYPEDENVVDGEDKEPAMVHSSKLTTFNQRELVELAFANDDVVQEFEQEKQQTIEAQAPKDEDITLPGWGSWGGEKLKPKKRLFKAAKPGSGVDQNKRKDRKLSHVIINEAHNPKLEKYTVRHVPSQYRSQEEFEHTMRGAVGKEWNPTTTYHKAIKPKVLVTKVGKVIDPIKAPFKP